MNPADNPKEIKRMHAEENPEDDSKVAENTEGTEWDLREMSAAHLGHNEYRILSTRNGSVNHYQVDIREGTCSCPSELFNLADNEACPHLTKALLVHDARLDPSDWAGRDLQILINRADDLMRELRDTKDFAKTLTENEAKHSQSSSETTQEPTSNEPTTRGLTADEAAENLRDAFDEVVPDMNVDTSGGKVWIQTGQETPDTLPGPGNVSVFDALLKDPDQVQFVHDDHEWAGDRPNQWFKNALVPNDVENYIEEVLR